MKVPADFTYHGPVWGLRPALIAAVKAAHAAATAAALPHPLIR
ncbi:hypothetical protein [Hymenobacter ruber]